MTMKACESATVFLEKGFCTSLILSVMIFNMLREEILHYCLINRYLDTTLSIRKAPISFPFLSFPYQQVLVTLQYYASGTFQAIVGDNITCDQSTACRTIHRVTRALVRRMPQFIPFPTDNNAAQLKEGFHAMRGFPGVIGCVDGTHVWIRRPAVHEADFVNRKGYHSINVQVICDHRGKFLNVVARWPGSTHDSRVLRSSRVWDDMEDGRVDGFILGDSGYRCTTWLMTPLLQPQTPAERRYNAAHKGTRVVVEQTIGRWKRRFHVLHGENRMHDPNDNCEVIGATAVLHNIAVERNEPIGDNNEGPQMPQPDLVAVRDGNGHGQRTRQLLIETHFH